MNESRTTYRCPDCECTFGAEADFHGNVFCPDCGCLVLTSERRES